MHGPIWLWLIRRNCIPLAYLSNTDTQNKQKHTTRCHTKSACQVIWLDLSSLIKWNMEECGSVVLVLKLMAVIHFQECHSSFDNQTRIKMVLFWLNECLISISSSSINNMEPVCNFSRCSMGTELWRIAIIVNGHHGNRASASCYIIRPVKIWKGSKIVEKENTESP